MQAVEDVDCALAISGYDYLRALTSSFAKVCFQVQDVSSMKAALAWQIQRRETTVLMSAQRRAARAFIWHDLLHGTGMVEARDLTEYKVGLIRG